MNISLQRNTNRSIHAGDRWKKLHSLTRKLSAIFLVSLWGALQARVGNQPVLPPIGTLRPRALLPHSPTFSLDHRSKRPAFPPVHIGHRKDFGWVTVKPARILRVDPAHRPCDSTVEFLQIRMLRKLFRQFNFLDQLVGCLPFSPLDALRGRPDRRCRRPKADRRASSGLAPCAARPQYPPGCRRLSARRNGSPFSASP